MSTLDGNIAITPGEWDKLTYFLKQVMPRDEYNDTTSDNDINRKEIFLYVDPTLDGQFSTLDVTVGGFNCTLFKDVAAIFASHNIAFVMPINPKKIDCSKLPYFEEEKKLFSILSQNDAASRAANFIKGIRNKKCKDRMAQLASNKFLADDNFSGAEKAADLMGDESLKKKTRIFIKVAATTTEIEKLEKSDLPISKTAPKIQIYKSLLADYKDIISKGTY